MESLSRLFASRIARYAATLLLLLLVVYKLQPQHLLSALGSARPQYLAIASVLTVPFIYLKAVRWRLMLGEAGVDTSFSEALLSLVGGMGLALVTPARLGEMVRAAYLRSSQKLKIAGLVLVDKAFDVLVLVLLSISGAWVLLGALPGLGMAAIAVAGLIAVYWPRSVWVPAGQLARKLPGRQKLDRALSSLEVLTPRATSMFILLTALSFAVVLVQFGVILLSWRGPSPDIVFLTFPLVILTNVLPITIGGLGIREGAAALLLGHYGVSPAHAALAAFLMFTINTALPGLIGAFLLPAARPASPAATLHQP